MPKPSFERRLQRLERRAFPKPGTIEYDRMRLAEARRKLRMAEAMEAAAEEPAPLPKPAPPPVAAAPEPAPALPSAPPPAAAPPPKRRPPRKRVRKPEAEPKPEPKPEPQWWEENARWRQRGPEDYRWSDAKPNMCLVDYDPLAWFDDEE